MISRASNSRLLQTAVLLVAVGGTWAAPTASAQATGTAADQTVDQLELFNSSNKKVLRLKFDVTPTKVVGLTAAPTSNLRACQSTANNGLICLDGQVVRQWPTTIEHPLSAVAPTGTAGTPLFSCTDSAFAFKGNTPCTTMTVDTKGGIWIAGLRSNNTYSLMQVVKKNGTACPAAASSTPAFAPLAQSTDYCFRARATGRPVITDLSPVEGNLVEQYFTEGEGVLGVEAGSTVVYYPYDFTKNRRTYGSWPTTVQSAAIFQRVESTVLQTYVVVAASSGIVYSRAIRSGDNGTESKFVHANSNSDPLKLPRGNACSKGGEKQFGVRASETSGRVFITSRNYCRAYVLTPLPNMQGIALPVDSVSTTSTSGNYPPDGLSVAPGIAVNVAQGCTDGVINLGDPGGCPLIEDSVGDTNVYPGLRMYGVELEPGSPTSLRIYKVEGIPDCRYLRYLNLPRPAVCDLPGVVVNDPKLADGTQNFPQRQFLNVTPMLPSNVTDVFDASGKKPTGLPAMLIQPRARAQADNGYYFEAIFGVADPNIRFRETFTVEFDVSDPNLAGTNLGCGLHQEPVALPFNQWDIMTVVSERYSSVGGPLGLVANTTNFLGQTVPAEHVDTMINKDCYNPGPNAGTRWSMYSYNLELAEDTPVRSSPSSPVTSFVYSRPVTYFGNLLLSLHTELGKAQTDLACTNVDALGNTGALAATPPLSSATCTTLNNSWATAQSSMTSCAAAAASAPAFSAQTPVPAVCGTFFTQFSAYKSQVEAAASAIKGTGLDKDPANRAGELWSRTDVIKHVFEDHFVKAWSLGLGTP